MKKSFSVFFHPEAEKEYYESINWYENAQSGLGKKFITEIEKNLDYISFYPNLFPLKHGNLRECVVKKFPFIIVYEIIVIEAKIYIISIYHTSRIPSNKYRSI